MVNCVAHLRLNMSQEVQKPKLWLILPAGITYLISSLLGTAAVAQSENKLFAGKTISIYIGFGAGGGYDYYGRLAARYMAKYIPGSPNIVPQNMPGAGSFRAANFLFNAAPKDGTALGVLTQTIAIEEALRAKGVQYKSAEFNWIGRMTSVLEVTLVGPSARVKSIFEARDIVVPVASTGAGSPSSGYHLLLNAFGGTQFKLVTGYTGSTQTMMATEAGEVDASSTSWNTLQRTKADMLASGAIRVLVQYSSQRHRDLPSVPAVVELGTSSEGSQVMAFYASSGDIGRALAAPPGLTGDRVSVLRSAFDRFLKDPDLQNEVSKTGIEFDPASGEAVQELIRQTANAPAWLLEKAGPILAATE